MVDFQMERDMDIERILSYQYRFHSIDKSRELFRIDEREREGKGDLLTFGSSVRVIVRGLSIVVVVIIIVVNVSLLKMVGSKSRRSQLSLIIINQG